MTLQTAVYTAHHGYAWSNVPDGMTIDGLNEMSRTIATARGDFYDPMTVETGVVSDGRMGAVFAVQNVANWDATGRAADYLAFAFFPLEKAGDVDFVSVLSHDFFWSPTHEPVAALEYDGPAAEKPVPIELVTLVRENRCRLTNPRSIGMVLALCGKRSASWLARMQGEGILDVQCTPWLPEKDI